LAAQPKSVTLLSTACEHVAGTVVVWCAGDVDLSNAEQLRVAIESTSAAVVIVELSELGHLDGFWDRRDRAGVSHGSLEESVASHSGAARLGSPWAYRISGCDLDRLVPTVEAALALIHRER
jgi:hypothetical protein